MGLAGRKAKAAREGGKGLLADSGSRLLCQLRLGLGQLIFCSRRQAVDTAVLYLTVRNSFH